MEQVFNIVLVKLAVGFILLMVYRDILTNILHCSLCMTKKSIGQESLLEKGG